MRWLIYREHDGTREPLRIVDAGTSEEALERVRKSTPRKPDDAFFAVEQTKADQKDWSAAERNMLKQTQASGKIK
jgi:hypothetical protein